MKLALYAVILFVAAIGTVIGGIVITQIQISSLGNLTATQIFALMNTVLWFLVALATWFGSKNIEGKPFSILSLDFFLTWISCSFGVIIGVIISFLVNGGSISLTLDTIMDSFFLYLPFTLAPTATATLGFREKNA